MAPCGFCVVNRISDGTEMLGGVVSAMMTSMLVLLVFPAASVAVQVTRVEPIGKIDPLGGSQVALIVAVPASSVASIGPNATATPRGPSASDAGTLVLAEKTGDSVSRVIASVNSPVPASLAA